LILDNLGKLGYCICSISIKGAQEKAWKSAQRRNLPQAGDQRRPPTTKVADGLWEIAPGGLKLRHPATPRMAIGLKQ
jgi:hypothetical protein